MSARKVLNNVQFAHDDSDPDLHEVTAHHGGQEIGRMLWLKSEVKHEPLTGNPIHGMITTVDVDPGYQRRGVGTGMWNYAHHESGLEPKPAHSISRTPAGKGGGGDAWARKVGGHRPMTSDQARLLSTGL
jgi:hypothetical protein